MYALKNLKIIKAEKYLGTQNINILYLGNLLIYML